MRFNNGGPIIPRLETWVRSSPFTSAIIFVCVAVWVAELLFGTRFVMTGVFVPSAALSEPWRFVTSIFMHDWQSPLHIFFNMFALAITGPVLEKLLGWKRYLILFFVSGIAGNVLMFIWGNFIDTHTVSLSLGASGAVFGFFGALIIFFKHLGMNSRQLIATVAINLLVISFIGNIAWQAHVGGLVAGIVIALIYTRFTKTRTVF